MYFHILAQYGNCIIRRNPPTSLGYKDPDMYYRSASNLYSCTTRGNSKSEIHVIGIYGSRYENEYMISVLPRGPITKPIILVLVAYYPTYWKINTTVDLEEVLYGVSILVCLSIHRDVQEVFGHVCKIFLCFI